MRSVLPFFGEEKFGDALDFTTGKILTEANDHRRIVVVPQTKKPYLDGSAATHRVPS
jgi:hypothetical protein